MNWILSCSQWWKSTGSISWGEPISWRKPFHCPLNITLCYPFNQTRYLSFSYTSQILTVQKVTEKNLLNWKQNNDKIARGTPRLPFCYMDSMNYSIVVQTNLQKVHTQAKKWNTSNAYFWQIVSMPLTQYLATNVLFTRTNSAQPYNWKRSIQIRLKRNVNKLARINFF